jgi:hypothetical protein
MNEWEWIKAALYAVPTIASVVTAWAVLTGRAAKTEISGQPVEVKGAVRLATWEELEAVSERIDKLDGELESIRNSVVESERRLQQEASRRAANLHKRIDDMDKDIGNVPARTIALLKETKNLI